MNSPFQTPGTPEIYDGPTEPSRRDGKKTAPVGVRDEKTHPAERQPFYGVLYERPDTALKDESAVQAPSFLGDLNLDQIVDAITKPWKEYNLTPFFNARLTELAAIVYRQEVMADLDEKTTMEAIAAFTAEMRTMRVRLDQAKRMNYYKWTVQRLFLEAIDIYCKAVARLSQALKVLNLTSRGLLAFSEYVAEYAATPAFLALATEADKLKSDLSQIRYCVLLRNGGVTVRHCEEEDDYSDAVEATFAKFSRNAGSQHRLEVPPWEGINHIEAMIQDRVALLEPAAFGALDNFCTAHTGYLDETIARFDREIHFYIAYLTYIARFRSAGLMVTRPAITNADKHVSANETFDLALAGKLLDEKAPVVTNDFFLAGSERVFVVSGPNQGGKTTFARTFGQMHYLASLGCFVPGTDTRLFLFDHLFTHFERQEDITNLRGKLQDDLVRIHQILDQATPNSILIMNEIFSSTALKDAVYLGKKILGRVTDLDLIAVCVTFLDELATFSDKTVSVVSIVNPNNPAVRTYKLERRPADGLAYALAIAQKYRVTYDSVKERIKT